MRHSSLLMHFVRLDIQSHCPNVHAWIHQYYQSFAQETLSTERCTWTLTVEESGSLHELEFEQSIEPAHSLNFSIAGVPLYCSNSHTIVGCGPGQFPSTIEIDFSNNTVRANIARDILRVSDSFAYGFFRTLLRLFILPASGVFMPHGAVVTKQGKTFFLSGDSGTGKSTTSLQLVQHGFSIVSDDSPLICLSNGEALALSSLDDFCLSENALQLLPNLRAHVSGQRESSGKWRVSRSCMDDSLQSLANVPAQITDFIILCRAEVDAPRLSSVTRQDAMVAMLNQAFTFSSLPGSPAHTCSLEARDARVFDIISKVINGVRAYKLEFSSRRCSSLPDVFDKLLDDA